MLHRKSYSFKLPLVTNDIGKTLGEGLLFAEGGLYEVQRKLMLPAFSHAYIKGPVSGFWPKGGGNDRESGGGGARVAKRS